MSAISVRSPFPVFTDLDGKPLDAGYIFIGTANLDPETNPIAVYWDSALTQLAAQPLRTIGGYPARAGTPARVYAGADFSIRVKNKNGITVYSAPAGADLQQASAVSFTGFKGQVGTVQDLGDADGSDWVGFTPLGSGAVPMSLQEKARQQLSVWDFLTSAQKSDVAAKTLLVDCTTNVQRAIDEAFGLGWDLDLGGGYFAIEGTLTNKGMVSLIGKGGGRIFQPDQAPFTMIKRVGSNIADLLRIGHQGTVKAGGGIVGVRLDGAAVCGKTLSIKDHQQGHYRGLVLVGSSQDALYFTNTDGLDPTGLSLFDDLQITLRGGATQNANGIHFDGIGSGVSGVTICKFVRPRIEHANGAGVKVGYRGDGMTWIQPHIFRADVETGIGVWASSTSADQVIGGHTFVGPIISSGIRIDYPGAALGWVITNGNDVDVNSGHTRIATGIGGDDVSILSSYSGRLAGPTRTHGWRDTLFHDSMEFFDWSAGVLNTGCGHWKTSTGAGTSITDGGQPGGAIQLNTSNVLNSEIWVRNTSTFANGINANTNYPALNVTIAPLALANIVCRFGLFNDFSNSVVNGAFIEYDPSINSNFRCICVSAGVSTTVVSSVDGAIEKTQWRIEVSDSGINFWYRTGINKLWGLGASINTNITSSPLSVGFYIRAKSAASVGMHVYDVKYSHIIE